MLDFLLRGFRPTPHVDRALLAAPARAGVLIGLLTGLSVGAVAWALVLAVAAIVGFGSGSPAGNFRATLSGTWPLFPAMVLAAGLAAPARRHFLGRHPRWGQVGAGLTVLAVFLLLVLPWAFRQRLVQGDLLTREPVYATPGTLYRATEADGWLLFWFGLLALGGALVFTVVMRRVFDYGFARRRDVAPEVIEVAAPDPGDFQRQQTGLGQLKFEIAELRARPTRHVTIDPVISGTHVVDREVDRAVPRWMEPLAALNFGPGKFLLIGFIAAAVLWFSAVAARVPQEWVIWRAATFVTPDSPAYIVPFELVANVSAIRIYAVSGEGDVLAAVARRGSFEAIPDKTVRARGDRAIFSTNSGLPTVIGLEDLEPGPYDLRLSRFSGAVLVGVAAERTSALSTHTLALILGIAAAGIIAGGAGLLLLALANLRAYFDF
jgi:hypothetical protein